MSQPKPKLSEYTEFQPQPERRTPLPITTLPVNSISEETDPTLEIRTLIEQLQQTARDARTQLRATEHEKDALAQQLARAERETELLRENERELRSHFVGGIMLVTNTAPGVLEPLLTKVLAEVDPNLTVTDVMTMQEQVALSFDQERAVASLAGLFGIVALLLAAIGLYGVTAYAVAQRTNEIGIRMALGADRGKIVQLVLRGASNRVFLGLLLGVPLAIGAGRLLSSELYGVSSWDPLALTVATGALAICAFVAAIVPASRAASISPTEALRTE